MDTKWVFPESPEEFAAFQARIAAGEIEVLDRTSPSWFAYKGGWQIRVRQSRPTQPAKSRWSAFAAVLHWFANA